MKKTKGGEVRCKHKSYITWDTDTEYGEWVKCVGCGHEMPKHNWYFMVYILVMLAYAYYSL